jgi:hypothetical protein
MGTIQFPSARGVMKPINGMVLVRGRLLTDALGNASLRITGLKPGSEVRVFNSESAEINGGTDSASGDITLLAPYYVDGNALNNLRILVVNLGFEIIDIAVTITPKGLTIPVFQRIDRSYKNPN